MRKEVLESDETSVLRRLKHRLTVESNLQRDWWLNWGCLVPGGLPDEHQSSKGYVEKDAFQCKLERDMEPKSKYTRKVLNSHVVGWYPNVELFGVAQHRRMQIDEDLHVSRKPWRIAKPSSKHSSHK
jgi:hypothetical protein